MVRLGQVVPLRAEGTSDSPGRVTGYLGTLTDITETKRAEEELRRSDQRYQALSENSAVGIWQVTPDGASLYVNPTMQWAVPHTCLSGPPNGLGACGPSGH